MKVGIITFHMAWNCGAVLQCYALQKKLELMGHDAWVINYRPSYKKYRYVRYGNPVRNALEAFRQQSTFAAGIRSAVKAGGRTLLDYRPSSGRMRQYHGFQEFTQTYLKQTAVYSSLDELKRNPPACDVYISGSDQLWNPILTGGQADGAYYLDFGDPAVRRITYAVSACEFTKQNMARLPGLLGKLDAISLREEEFAGQIGALAKQQITICPDPTFLIDSAQYAALETVKPPEAPDEYIAVYLLLDEQRVAFFFKTVQALSSRWKLPVVVLSGPRRWPYPVRQIDGILPQEVVCYLKHARFVVTNSFHATAFSIIYHKQFTVIPTENRSARVIGLLGKLGLSDRLTETIEDLLVAISREIHYNETQILLDQMRLSGTAYLENQLTDGS